MRNRLLWSLGTCALYALSAAQGAPPGAAPEPPGPFHNPALAKPDPAHKGSPLPGLGDPLKLGNDLRQSGPSHDPSLLGPLPGQQNSQLISAAVARNLAGSLKPSGPVHDRALAKPDPALKGTRLPDIGDAQKLGAELRQAGPSHDRSILKPLPGEKVNNFGPSAAIPSPLDSFTHPVVVVTLRVDANADYSPFAENPHDYIGKP